MLRSWIAPYLELLEERLQRGPALRPLRKLLAPEALGSLLGEILRLALVLDDSSKLAGRRRTVEAENLDRLARAGLLDALAAIVVERAHLPGGITGNDRVADAKRAALDEHGRYRPATDVES